MYRSRLRIYYGPEDKTQTVNVTTASQESPTVTVNAGEVFAALADAVDHGRSWLRDFEDDKITLSADLYDVILAYEHFRRPSA